MFEPISIGLGLASFAVKQAVKALFTKKKERTKKDVGVLVVEISRPILRDVMDAYGEDAITAVMSFKEPVKPEQVHRIAADVYKSVAAMQRFYKTVHVVMSGPNIIWALAGQFIGMHHFDLRWIWWQPDGYHQVDDASKFRALLF